MFSLSHFSRTRGIFLKDFLNILHFIIIFHIITLFLMGTLREKGFFFLISPTKFNNSSYKSSYKDFKSMYAVKRLSFKVNV